jgi:hypothetical protein
MKIIKIYLLVFGIFVVRVQGGDGDISGFASLIGELNKSMTLSFDEINNIPPAKYDCESLDCILYNLVRKRFINVYTISYITAQELGYKKVEWGFSVSEKSRNKGSAQTLNHYRIDRKRSSA